MSRPVPTWDEVLALCDEDLTLARSPHAPGVTDPAILRSGLRIERKLDTIAALLTEIRDRLPPAPVVAPTIDPAPSPAPQPPAKRPRGS